MLINLLAGSILGLGLLLTGSASEHKVVDCCAANLACCQANLPCCQGAKAACCQKGQKCCAEGKACCSAAHKSSAKASAPIAETMTCLCCSTSKRKVAGQDADCCKAKLACCSAKSACCSANPKPPCCHAGAKCCAENKACCSAAKGVGQK